jgi:hypothetical protein
MLHTFVARAGFTLRLPRRCRIPPGQVAYECSDRESARLLPWLSDVGNALPQQYLFLPSGHVDDLINLPSSRETLENPSEPSEPARRSEHPAFQVPMRFMLGARSTPSAPAEPRPNAYRRPFRRLFMSRRHIFRRPLLTIGLQTLHLGCAVSQCLRSAGHGRSRALTHSLGQLAGQSFFTANSALSHSTKNLTPLSALAADAAIIRADEEHEPQSRPTYSTSICTPNATHDDLEACVRPMHVPSAMLGLHNARESFGGKAFAYLQKRPQEPTPQQQISTAWKNLAFGGMGIEHPFASARTLFART